MWGHTPFKQKWGGQYGADNPKWIEGIQPNYIADSVEKTIRRPLKRRSDGLRKSLGYQSVCGRSVINDRQSIIKLEARL